MDEATKLLKEYIEKFDDDNVENEQLKNWLDSEWIPEIRDFLAKIP